MTTPFRNTVCSQLRSSERGAVDLSKRTLAVQPAVEARSHRPAYREAVQPGKQQVRSSSGRYDYRVVVEVVEAEMPFTTSYLKLEIEVACWRKLGFVNRHQPEVGLP